MKNIFSIKTMSYFVMIIIAGCGGANKKNTDNPFFSEFNTQFGVPPFDKIKFEHYQPALEEGMRLQMLEIDSIANNKDAATFDNTIAKFDASGQMLSRVSAVFYNELEANTNDSMQNLAQEMAPKMSKHNDDIMLNEKLFDRIKTVYNNREKYSLSKKGLPKLFILILFAAEQIWMPRAKSV